MAIGRPPKFSSKEERDAARREQVRRSVRSFRKRKLEKQLREQEIQEKLSGLKIQQDHEDAYDCAEQKGVLAKAGSQDLCSPFDIDKLSDRPQVELSFGFFPAIVQDFELATSRYPWALAQNQLNCTDNFLSRAILAGGARILSSKFNYEGLTHISRMAYQDTLANIRHRMENFSKADALPLIYAVTAVANFEIGDGSSRTPGTKWAIHAKALQKLVKAAGPETFQSPVGLDLLRGHRYIAIMFAMWEPSSNFLNEEAWRTIPFLIEGKTIEDELWDLTFDAPLLISMSSKLAKMIRDGESISTVRKTALACHAAASKLQSGLRRWCGEYEALNSVAAQPVVWSQPAASWFTQSISPVAREVFPESLYYSELMQAESYIRLWTVQFKLLETAKANYSMMLKIGLLDCAELWAQDFDLRSHLKPDPSLVSSSRGVRDSRPTWGIPKSQETDCDPEALIFNICRSMEFILGPDPRDLRGAIICGNVPIQVAAEYLAVEPDYYALEIKWSDSVREVMARRCLLQGKAKEVLTKLEYKLP